MPPSHPHPQCTHGPHSAPAQAPDPSGGLEVRTREGEWVAVPHHDGALLVNIGDMLSRWTNDHYVSTPHRVANTETSRRGRLSIAVFFHLDADTPVGGDLYATGGAPKYETVRYLDELVRKFEGNRMEVGAQANPSDPSHGANNGTTGPRACGQKARGIVT